MKLASLTIMTTSVLMAFSTAVNSAYITQEGHVQKTNKKDQSKVVDVEEKTNWDVYVSGGMSTYSEEDYTNDGFGFNIGAIKDGYNVGFIYSMDFHNDTIGSTGVGIVSGSAGLMLRMDGYEWFTVYPMIGYTAISTTHSRYGTEVTGGLNYGIGGSLELFDTGFFVEGNYKFINSSEEVNPTQAHIGIGYKF